MSLTLVLLFLFSIRLCLIFFFFFSSRRRHTRYWRDWSSDVCSSDLVRAPRGVVVELRVRRAGAVRRRVAQELRGDRHRRVTAGGGGGAVVGGGVARSGERRVGEEGRFRGVPDYLKKKKRSDLENRW